jgi:hypothetical protein
MAPKKKQKIDKAWFVGQLKDRKISMRALGRMMRRDIWSISSMFAGKRAMSMQEAKEIADILGVPLLEVMRRAGVQTGEHMMEISGTIEHGGEVSLNATGDETPAPLGAPATGFALLFRTPRGPLRQLDGAVAFTSPKIEKIDRSVTNRLCVVGQLKGPPLFGYLSSSRVGLQLLTFLSEEPVQGDDAMSLMWAAPVLWIRT